MINVRELLDEAYQVNAGIQFSTFKEGKEFESFKQSHANVYALIAIGYALVELKELLNERLPQGGLK